jgi:hypothetical protein
MVPLRVISLVLGLCGFIAGCGFDMGPQNPVRPSDAEFTNTVFPQTFLIEARVQIVCTSAGPQLVFTWQSTGQPLVFVGVFDENIAVAGGRIVNSDANIWAWHSGLGRGREGNVLFSQGRDVRDGILQENATDLVDGETYAWAVWAWDDSGTVVSHSSREQTFRVDRQATDCR